MVVDCNWLTAFKLGFASVLFSLGITGCVGTIEDPASLEEPGNGSPLTTGGEADGEVGSVASALSAGGTYLFRSGVTTSRCMDVAGGNAKDGTNIRQWTCNFSLAQKYRVESFAGGVRLVNAATNKCVDVAGNALVDFTNVQLWHCNGTGAQTFRVVDVPGGVNLVHIASGRCVGVADGNPGQAANVRIRGCNGSSAQTWVPREASGPVRIMPLGASITQGYGGTRAGYRWALSQQLDQLRVAHRFVGSNTADPGPLPSEQQHHEGHPGWVIAGDNDNAGLRQHIDAWLGANGASPDIVLVLVGSNDVVRGIDLANAGRRLDDLIGRIRSLKPDALIYVSTIPRVDDKPNSTAQYNDQVAAVVRTREQRGEAVHLVDAYTPLLEPGRKADSVHPNDAGYDVLARLWKDAILGQ
jgi:acyl-CoA thioesterase I